MRVSHQCSHYGISCTKGYFSENGCLRPYHQENTGSRLITEVKPGRAKLVLGWVTAWEYFVL